MEKQDQTQIQSKQKLLQQLRQFGFLDQDILKALKYTTSKEIAAEIIVKIMQEGPQADLSMYSQQKNPKNLNNPQEQSLFNSGKTQQEKPSEYKSPVRPKMLFIVNGSLKMGKGKICAQVAHAVIGAYLQIQQEAKFDQKSAQRLHSWESSGCPKIVVKAQTQKQMFQIRKKLQNLKIGLNTYLVQDAGHTQIKEGSKTILAIGPAFSNQIDPFTQHLKLA